MQYVPRVRLDNNKHTYVIGKVTHW